jgi:hypothetical protein
MDMISEDKYAYIDNNHSQLCDDISLLEKYQNKILHKKNHPLLHIPANDELD